MHGSVLHAALDAWDDGVDAVEEVVQASISRERTLYDRWLPILGTLGNSAPFIGLFGTVIGILTAFAALGRPLAPISQDAAAFFEDHVVIKDEAGQVAVEESAGLAVCDWFKGVKAAIHQNHGLLTASRHSIEAAAFWFIALERCCRQQLLVEASGHTPTLVSPERSRYSREHVGSEYIGWLHFQPIYDHLVATQPDMLG